MSNQTLWCLCVGVCVRGKLKHNEVFVEYKSKLFKCFKWCPSTCVTWWILKTQIFTVQRTVFPGQVVAQAVLQNSSCSVSETQCTGTNSNSSDNVIYACSTRINISDMPPWVSFHPASQAWITCWPWSWKSKTLCSLQPCSVVPTWMESICMSWTVALQWNLAFFCFSLPAASKETDWSAREELNTLGLC